MHQRVFAVPIHAGLELSSANKAWSESWSRALFPESQSDLWTFVEGRLQEVRGLFRSMLQKSGLDAPFQYFFPQFCWLVQPLAWQGHRILVCSMEWFPKTLRRLAPEGLSGLPEVLAHLLQCLSSLKLVWRHLMMCSHYLRPLQFARRWMMDFLCLLDGASSTNLTEWNSGALTLRTFSQNECHPSDNHPERVFSLESFLSSGNTSTVGDLSSWASTLSTASVGFSIVFSVCSVRSPVCDFDSDGIGRGSVMTLSWRRSGLDLASCSTQNGKTNPHAMISTRRARCTEMLPFSAWSSKASSLATRYSPCFFLCFRPSESLTAVLSEHGEERETKKLNKSKP